MLRKGNPLIECGIVVAIASILIMIFFININSVTKANKEKRKLIGETLIWQGKKIIVAGLDGPKYNVLISDSDKPLFISIDEDIIRELYQTQVVEKKP